ncbi:MAG TPA: HAMP domain-containing sensor histidine kinase [Vicinamibacteria bacterium]|nr:HAMP domain-containing sensor histidine kinase [Vicinamibacteria bacterium]
MLSSPTRHYRSLLFGTSALVLLLVLMGALQYRWLGQVGDAEAARLRAGASERAEQFARDFDREITRAFQWLRVDGETARQRDGRRYAARWARWFRLAAHPSMVRAVYVVDGDDLFRFEPASSSFRPAPWPPPLLVLRARIRDLERVSEGPPRPPRPRSVRLWDPIDDEAPALVGPILLFRPDTGSAQGRRVDLPISTFAVTQLDGRYLREALLPQLAERHFGGDSDYALVVQRRDDPKTIVFRTDRAAGADGQAGAASAELFSVRFEEMDEEEPAVAELATPPPVPRGRRAAGLRVAFFGPGFGPGRPPTPWGPRGDGGRWRLVVSHRAGPVEAVVAAARRRNLAIGAGTLVLLAASAVLVAVSAQRARRLADRQLEFVAGVSHELRSPLAVICSAGENLADGVVADAGRVRQYGGLVRDEGRRLADMVERVLDLAGTYSGRRRWCLEEVSVPGLLVDCESSLGPVLREAGLSIETRVESGPLLVRADRAALARAVQNLLQNAVRHGGEGRWIGLRAGLSRDVGRKEIVITVEDRGPGVPAAEVGQIFEPFFRGTHAVEGQVRGTGLGLSLVKRIVEAHGGTVGVKTEVGRGSAFTIVLPAATPSTEPLAHGTAHSAR